MRKVDNGEKRKKRKTNVVYKWPLTSLPVNDPNIDRLERRTLVPKYVALIRVK